MTINEEYLRKICNSLTEKLDGMFERCSVNHSDIYQDNARNTQIEQNVLCKSQCSSISSCCEDPNKNYNEESISLQEECNPQITKDCTERAFSCQEFDDFRCYGGHFYCGSNELFQCKTGTEPNDQFQCNHLPTQGGFDCEFSESESFVCDGSMFCCYAFDKAQTPFTCEGSGTVNFNCTNDITYDFWCGSGVGWNGGHFSCDSSGSQDGFYCDANHVFKCEGDFDCNNTHTCSPQDGECNETAAWRPESNDDGSPSDFRCDELFDCGRNGDSPSGDFSCVAMSEFICGAYDLEDREFSCHNNFVCHPTDGEGYEGNGEAFVCTDGAFDCGTEGFNCTGDTDKFRCVDGFDCSQGFDCSTFDCYDEFECDPPFNCLIEYRCRPMFCPVPSQDPFEQPPEAFDCSETFTCTAHFKCVNSVQFGGCHPTPANFACSSIAFNPPS